MASGGRPEWGNGDDQQHWPALVRSWGEEEGIGVLRADAVVEPKRGKPAYGSAGAQQHWRYLVHSWRETERLGVLRAVAAARRAMGDRRGEADTLNHIGVFWSALGE